MNETTRGELNRLLSGRNTDDVHTSVQLPIELIALGEARHSFPIDLDTPTTAIPAGEVDISRNDQPRRHRPRPARTLVTLHQTDDPPDLPIWGRVDSASHRVRFLGGCIDVDERGDCTDVKDEAAPQLTSSGRLGLEHPGRHAFLVFVFGFFLLAIFNRHPSLTYFAIGTAPAVALALLDLYLWRRPNGRLRLIATRRSFLPTAPKMDE